MQASYTDTDSSVVTTRGGRGAAGPGLGKGGDGDIFNSVNNKNKVKFLDF